VENVSLPPVVEEALDRRTSMGIVGDLKDYATFQAAEAMTAAAANPGGGASEGIGLGIGFAMATRMAEALGPMARPPAAEPPPVPTDRRYFVAVNGHQTGPFSRADVEHQIREGQLLRDSLVWTEGLADWTPAGQVPELLPVFSMVPPPIPGN
jgi:hypothetical protein